ncbi:MAG: hypothetical protein ACFFG0_48505 [Candidatus Thorarchaeota archaeon]
MCNVCEAIRWLENEVYDSFLNRETYVFRAIGEKAEFNPSKFQVKRENDNWGKYIIPTFDLAGDSCMLGTDVKIHFRGEKSKKRLELYLDICNGINLQENIEKYKQSKMNYVKEVYNKEENDKEFQFYRKLTLNNFKLKISDFKEKREIIENISTGNCIFCDNSTIDIPTKFRLKNKFKKQIKDFLKKYPISKNLCIHCCTYLFKDMYNGKFKDFIEEKKDFIKRLVNNCIAWDSYNRIEKGIELGILNEFEINI